MFGRTLTRVANSIHSNSNPNGVRGIYGKVMRESIGARPKPKPFPWREKQLWVWKTWFDTTSDKLDENSKVIVIDGPPGIGKTKLAKELAEDFDMLHFPEVTMDDFYINDYGYDMRKCDPELPENVKSYDHTDFCRNPLHRSAGAYQLMMYTLRYSQYMDALAHLLNTGQGVILERSPFSDFVFMEAMYESKFISSGVRSVYGEVKLNTLHELLRPHLAIYLDAPVDVVQKKIKERNLPHEKDSKAVSAQYLSLLERFYKQHYLKDISNHAELLVYDWASSGDTEIVIEDIERIVFDNYDSKSTKMRDWQFPKEQALNDRRRVYTNNKSFLMHYFNVARHDVPELMYTAEDCIVRDAVWYNAPGMKFELGYNKDMGDSNILLKTKLPHRDRPF